MAIELVDLPIKHGYFPVRYVDSPGGNKSPTSGGLSHLHPGELNLTSCDPWDPWGDRPGNHPHRETPELNTIASNYIPSGYD